MLHITLRKMNIIQQKHNQHENNGKPNYRKDKLITNKNNWER